MDKNELIRQLHEKSGTKLTLKDLSVIVDQLLDLISDRLAEGEEVKQAGFGTFSLPQKAIKPVASIKPRRTKR